MPHMSVNTFSMLVNMREGHPDQGLKLVPCLAIICEAFTCSRWEQTWRPTARKYAEAETLEHSAVNCRVHQFLLSSPCPRLWAFSLRGSRPAKESEGMEDTKKIPSKSTWLLYWLTETKVTGTGPTWLCTRLGPISERRSGHIPPSLTQKLPLIDNHLQTKA